MFDDLLMDVDDDHEDTCVNCCKDVDARDLLECRSCGLLYCSGCIDVHYCDKNYE